MKSSLSIGVALLALGSVLRAQAPAPYCTAGTSSNGCTPSITANVQPALGNNSGCVITTSGVEGQKLGLAFYGIYNVNFAPTPWAPGSTSFRCVRPPTQRLGPPLNSGGAAGQCNGTLAVSWDAFHVANPGALGTPWFPGQQIYVQSWYRDPLAPTTVNLSNAVELVFSPSSSVTCATALPGMVAIPAGLFAMGSDAPGGAPYYGQSIERPVHLVTISRCFWMGATEVTQAQYEALMGTNPSQHSGSTTPVEYVSWHEAMAYCAALTAQQSALGNVPAGYTYRLPTEAEWEYACRAGSTLEFAFGSALFCNEAQITISNHSNTFCSPFTQFPVPVGGFAPNAFGLFDMHGNVAEWCLDSFAAYGPGHAVDPYVNTTPLRVFRGGSFPVNSALCRSAYRTAVDASFRAPEIGFRVVLAPIL